MAFKISNGIVSPGILGGTGIGLIEAGGAIVAIGDPGVDNLGVSTITVNGSVLSDQQGLVFLAVPGASKVTVGADGSIWSDAGVAISAGHTVNVTNSGLIGGNGTALAYSAAGAWTVMNNKTGTIDANGGDVVNIGEFATGIHTLTNSGELRGNFTSHANLDSIEKVTNTGFWIGAVTLSKGNDSVTNSGYIGNTVDVGAGDDVVTNKSRMDNGVLLGEGKNKLTNSGQIGNVVTGGSGDDTVMNTGSMGLYVSVANSIELGGGDDVLTNTKFIQDGVDLGSGLNKVTNSGTIGKAVTGGDDADTITNSGSMGGLSTGKGNDIVTNTGTINSIVDLGEGADKYTGGAKFDRVQDSAGADTITLGGGDDFYTPTGVTLGQDGTDSIDGGANTAWNGIGEPSGDFYYAQAATNAVFVNLNATEQTDTNTLIKYAGNTAYGLDVSGFDNPLAVGFTKDTIKGFENVSTGSGDDVIFGNALNNFIEAGAGHDHLFGGAGNDYLGGGDGSDHVYGGAGRDNIDLNGGSPDAFKDRIYYTALSDSGLTSATRDYIRDFDIAGDRLVLTALDADTTLANDQAFNFIGMNQSFAASTPGQLRAVWAGENTIVSGDVNGDGKADFSIEFAGRLTFTGGEFDL